MIRLLLLGLFLFTACSYPEESPTIAPSSFGRTATATPISAANWSGERLAELYPTDQSEKIVVWYIRDKVRGVDCWVVAEGDRTTADSGSVAISCLRSLEE